MSERLTKKQLRDDRFLEIVQMSLAYARDNTTVVVAGVVGFIVLIVLAVRIGGSAAGLERSAGNPEAQRALSDARSEFAYGRLDAGKAALEQVRSQWRKDMAGREATYVLATAYLEGADFEQARLAFEDYLREPLPHGLLTDGAQLGIAACLEESGDLNGAMARYEGLWATGTTPGTKIEAGMAAARVARSQGNPAKARELFQAVADRFPASPEAQEARFQLLLMDGGKAAS